MAWVYLCAFLLGGHQMTSLLGHAVSTLPFDQRVTIRIVPVEHDTPLSVLRLSMSSDGSLTGIDGHPVEDADFSVLFTPGPSDGPDCYVRLDLAEQSETSPTTIVSCVNRMVAAAPPGGKTILLIALK